MGVCADVLNISFSIRQICASVLNISFLNVTEEGGHSLSTEKFAN